MIVFFFILFAVLRFCDLRGGGRLLLTAPQVPPHGPPRRLRLVEIYQALAPSGPLEVYVSCSRHHTALLRRLCGVTRILPLRGCSRYMSPRHGTTLRSFVACAGLPSSCPFGAAQGNSPFSILRSRFFPHFALVRGDIGEDLPLREEQDGGEHRAHHVGDGAGGPDACESVQSGIGEQHRHDVG